MLRLLILDAYRSKNLEKTMKAAIFLAVITDEC
jgi:hypothetical protein